MKYTLQTDTEFMQLCVPASQEETEQLERSLLMQGCREPIITWNGIILDGHKRYQFCRYEEMEFDVQEMDFHNREEAIAWICRQRIPFVHRHSVMYKYLVGKLYINQKKLDRVMRKQLRQQLEPDTNPEDTTQWPTTLKIGNELGINRCTVGRNGIFAEIMDAIANNDSELYQEIIAGNIHIQKNELPEIAQMDSGQLAAFKRRHLAKIPIVRESVSSKRQKSSDAAEQKPEKQLTVGIKEMPVFDPDMELRGLLFTVPSWIAAIARAEKNTDMEQATMQTKEQLSATLCQLEEQIRLTLEVLK